MENLIIINADNTAEILDISATTKLSDIIVKHPDALGFYLAKPI